ncbi:MAG: ABC transporter permease [Wenzhouxiangellaceae bacterium]|nr:ABC transporter permease [Wenzhouxiangellaceae bacterium]
MNDRGPATSARPVVNPGADAPLAPPPRERPRAPATPWRRAVRRFLRDGWGLAGGLIVAGFAIIAVGSWLGAWGTDWVLATGGQWEGPSARHPLGTTILGQDILARALASTRTAFEIGLVVAALSTLLGALFGALAGWFAGGPADAAIAWLKGVLDSIPFYLFVAAVAFALDDHPWAMHLAMIATFWTTTARLVRAEVIRLREREFVEAARAVGVPPMTILRRHVVPNTIHVLLVQASIVFVAAIKSEVILSFLGLGVEDGISWGLMIAESTTEITSGRPWNFIAASSFLFLLVMGFNLFADAMQDALDPREERR